MITNLEYYRVFYCAASEKSFTRAAKKLYVTQSAVSQTISHLEKELGCQLLNRTSKGLTLTKEGEILYKSLQNAFTEIDHGERSLLSHKKEPQYLRIGTVLPALQAFLLPVLSAFRQKHPDIQIILRESTNHALTEMLETGDISIAFMITPLEYGTRMDLKKVTNIQDIACASPEYPINFERIYTPDQLLDYPLISTDRKNGIRTTVDEWFWDSGIVFSPFYTTRSGSETKELTVKGFGIGIIPEEIIVKDLEQGTLKRVRTTSLPRKRTIYLASKPQEKPDYAENEFLSMLKASLPS